MAQDFIPLASGGFDGIRPGRIRHAELSLELLAQLKEIYSDAAHFIWGTLEEFERGFMYDMHPEREAAAWQQITAALRLYRERHMGGRQLGNEEGAKLVSTLSVISTGRCHTSEDLRQLPIVDKYVARRLLACWQSLYGSAFAPVILEVRPELL
jgi:hypothetical protein